MDKIVIALVLALVMGYAANNVLGSINELTCVLQEGVSDDSL